MFLREFIQKYPNDSFNMMMPGGFVFRTPEQARELLAAGGSIMGHPGDPEFAMPIDAKELLSEKVLRARWENQACHMLTIIRRMMNRQRIRKLPV